MSIDSDARIDVKRVRALCFASFILGGSLVLLAVSVAALLFVHYRREKLRQVLASTSLPAETVPQVDSAAGSIEALEIPLANMGGNFPDRTERLAQPRWFFEKFSESQLARFFNGCALSPAEKSVLLDRNVWELCTNGIIVSPPDALVWALSRQSRTKIYSTLARSAANYPQSFPFRIPLNGFDLKFRNCGLPAAQLERIRHLTYTNGGFLCFSDLRAAQAVLKPDDFNDLVETLYTVPTFILRLHINPGSNLDALIKYWGRGGREKLIAPILNALAKVPGGSAINVSYLMPPFARLRLYTFPGDWKDPTAARQDCFYTAMNFFNEPPNTNFFDATYSRKALETDYQPIAGQPAFGDLVTLFNPAGEAVHTCVYVADDFVFTKNGVNSAQPWVLMRMADMLLIYFAPEKTGQILFLRRKNSP